MTYRLRFFRYVPFSLIPDFEADGWIYSSSLGAPHAAYSLLMEYPVFWGA